MELQMKLERLLLDLGDTPDAVAAFLEGQGVKGEHRNPYRCPVSVYVGLALGMFVTTGITGCVLGGEDEPWVRADMPTSVQSFVTRFDRGEYPALEAR